MRCHDDLAFLVGRSAQAPGAHGTSRAGAGWGGLGVLGVGGGMKILVKVG